MQEQTLAGAALFVLDGESIGTSSSAAGNGTPASQQEQRNTRNPGGSDFTCSSPGRLLPREPIPERQGVLRTLRQAG